MKPDQTAKRITQYDIDLGARVRLLRMTRNISQEKLAEACGVTFQQIQKYEKGLNRISSGRLEAIAKALGTNIRAMFPALGDPGGDLPNMNANQIKAAVLIGSASEEKQVKAVKLLQIFLE